MLDSLGVSHSGLNAAKVSVENVSNNIANENTPGYKKRVVQLSEYSHIDSRITGRGVSTDDVDRITSQYTADRLINENSKTGYYEKLSSMLGSVESVFKETDESGLPANLDRYFQAIENLRTTPSSQMYKTTLENSGEALAESLKTIYSDIEKLQISQRSQLEDSVDSVNRMLKEIGTINEQLQRLDEPTNDLLDKRDFLENSISKYLKLDISRDNNYSLGVGNAGLVRFNTSITELNVKEEKILQVDKYIKESSNNESIVEFADGHFDNKDIISYKLNNEFEVNVQFGEAIVAPNGSAIDLGNGSNIVDETNYLRALVHKINHDANMSQHIDAYNGTRYLDNGELVTNDTKDNYLRIESKVAGVTGSFEGRITVVEGNALVPLNTDSVEVQSRNSFYKDEAESIKAEDKVSISIFNTEVKLGGGSLKAQIENLSSENSANKYQSYLDKLNSFARTLADVTDKYIQKDNDDYLYGEALSDEKSGIIKNIGLFTGSSVNNLSFNKNAINDLDKDDLEYLASMQWKTDFSFNQKVQDNTSDDAMSLSGYFQEIKVTVSSDKETNDLLYETQETVQLSIQASFNELTKVDKDEEMISLIKFQSAYTANAKIVTAIDEMIQVLLGLKK